MPTELRQRIIDIAVTDPAAAIRDIAQVLGCSPWTVAAALKEARKLGLSIPRRPRPTVRPREVVELRPPEDVRRILHDAAEAREMSLGRLVLRLVAEAARGGLIDAILDDGAADV